MSSTVTTVFQSMTNVNHDKISFNKWLEGTLSTYSQLDSVDQATTLNALLAVLEPSQLYAFSQRLSELAFRDFMTGLPRELVVYILKYLEGDELLACCLVSKSWNKIICSLQDLWCSHAVRAGADISGPAAHSQELLHPSSEVTADCFSRQGYKQLYLRVQATLRGFSTGTSIQIQENFIDKENWRITFVKYLNGRIITGCDDHTVQVWDLARGNTLTTVATNSVCSLTMLDNHLYTASFNANADLWDLSSSCHCQTFCGHTGAVFAVDVTIDDSFLLTGSVDKTAKLWNLRQKPASLLLTLADVHQDWVFHVKFIATGKDNLRFLTCDSKLVCSWQVRIPDQVVTLHKFASPKMSVFTSFYHVPADPFQLFASQWVEANKSSSLSKHLVDTHTSSIQQLFHFRIPIKTLKAILLGAGRKFAFIMCSISRKDFHIIDLCQKTAVATIVTPDVCMLTPIGATSTLCETMWLDGFNFEVMKDGMPLFAASVCNNTVLIGRLAYKTNNFLLT